ncbi:MAG: NAD(P)H-dependent oxidoreductase [Ilumatobacteraceae bacterium]
MTQTWNVVSAVDNLRVAVILGSTREGRFGPTVTRWFTETAGRLRTDMTLDVIDLAEADLPAVYPSAESAAVSAYAERLDRADAFVVVTPEYNHGYPASLKQAIDLAMQQWMAKPVGFVSYGGISGGLRAVGQLRQVFAEVHATTIRDTVSFAMAHGLFDDAGVLRDPEGPEVAAKTMLDELAWWANALRTARIAHPYAA